MSLSLYNQAATLPAGTALPGNAQALVNMVAQYLLIAGGQNFDGINYGSNTPSPEDRDKPWWRTDSSGNPMGMYSWNGSAWTTVPFVVPSGVSANRPLNPAVGTQYLDTTINRLLIYERGAWRTADGCVGQVIDVKAATLADALALNPGWIQDGDSIGRVVGAAGASGSINHAMGETVGSESVKLGINQIPSHTHQLTLANGRADGNTTNPPNQNVLFSGAVGGSGAATLTPDTAGSGEAVSLLQPTIYYWRLVKQ